MSSNTHPYTPHPSLSVPSIFITVHVFLPSTLSINAICKSRINPLNQLILISDFYIHHQDIFLILDEVPCNSDSVPKFFWGGPSGDWRGLKTNEVNVMMALTPIEEPFSRGLFRMLLDHFLSKNQGVDIQLPDNLSQLKLDRVYRCTQKILKFHEQVADKNNKSQFAYSKTNSSSCIYSPGHEIIGIEPDVAVLPSCGCFYACNEPLQHLLIKHWALIITTLKRVANCAGHYSYCHSQKKPKMCCVDESRT